MTVWIYSSNLNSPEFEPIERKWVRIGFFVEQDLSNKNYSKGETHNSPDKGS
jgi:hypothetical protein